MKPNTGGPVMKNFAAVIFVAALSGCMCRPGVVDCTTGRAYPGFCKPLCGGPCDPFMWAAGDCSCDCRCMYKCGYTPYGGRTVCGDEMAFVPSCISPPLRWAPPAVPTPPGGHVVHLPPNPPPLSPRKAGPTSAKVPPGPSEKPPAAPEPEPGDSDVEESTEEFEPPVLGPPAAESKGPRILHDARRTDQRAPSRL